MPASDEKQPLINKDARTDYSADGETSAGGRLTILFHIVYMSVPNVLILLNYRRWVFRHICMCVGRVLCVWCGHIYNFLFDQVVTHTCISVCLASCVHFNIFDAVSKFAEYIRLPREKRTNDENAEENCLHESFDMVWVCCCCCRMLRTWHVRVERANSIRCRNSFETDTISRSILHLLHVVHQVNFVPSVFV